MSKTVYEIEVPTLEKLSILFICPYRIFYYIQIFNNLKFTNDFVEVCLSYLKNLSFKKTLIDRNVGFHLFISDKKLTIVEYLLFSFTAPYSVQPVDLYVITESPPKVLDFQSNLLVE